MSEKPVTPALQGMADAFHLMDDLIKENEELIARADTAEHTADLLEAENQNLRAEIKRVNSERDHYLRAHTALAAQYDGISAAVEAAKKTAQIISYGDRGPSTEIEKAAQRPVPAFLQRGVVENPPYSADLDDIAERMREINVHRQNPNPINIDELAASIRGHVEAEGA